MKEYTHTGIRCCEQALLAFCSQIALFWASRCAAVNLKLCKMVLLSQQQQCSVEMQMDTHAKQTSG